MIQDKHFFFTKLKCKKSNMLQLLMTFLRLNKQKRFNNKTRILSVYEPIYEVVRAIPEGRVTTYGAIAKLLELTGGARQVGWAMNNAHTAEPAVPAHRVVNRLGRLSGKLHFETPTAMQERLEAEGIVVIDDQIQDFDRVLLDFFNF